MNGTPPPPPRSEPKSTSTTLSGTVLFVDDEANILAAIRRSFRGLGPRILLANGGAEGLQVLERESVDIVISDMRMPGMDGAQFLEQVATRWPTTVRVLMTGFADSASTIAAIDKGGVFRCLRKPWAPEDVTSAVRDGLAIRSKTEARDHGPTA